MAVSIAHGVASPARTVTGRYFGTGNGSRTTWNLAGLDSDVAYVAPAIYKSDWAGNSLLYATSRTNTWPTPITLHSLANANTTGVADQAVAPDGTTTADLIYPTTTGSNRWIAATNRTNTAAAWTNSIYVKTSGLAWVYILKFDGSGGAAWFNVVTGAKGTVAGGYSSTITSLGNGWYRCEVTGTSQASASLIVGISSSDNSLAVTANGTDGVYMWGLQNEIGSVATSLLMNSTPVTDYTLHATSGLVTFASAPAAAACLSYKQPWAPSSNAYMCFGTGNGTSTAFSLPYAPVTPLIYKNAVLQTLTTHYTVAPSGLVTFTAAPAANDLLTWTGTLGPMP